MKFPLMVGDFRSFGRRKKFTISPWHELKGGDVIRGYKFSVN